MRYTKDRRVQGVTFLEIVFAVAILAIAMIPIIQTSQHGVRRTGFNIHRVTATMLTNQLMERYRSMPFDWLDNKFGGGLDMADAFSSDPILASPALPASYRKMIADYDVRGSFEDISGDGSLGLLSFKVKWRPAPRMKESVLSLGKAVINYKKFGIRTVNTQASFVQQDSDSVASLNTDFSTPAPTAPEPTLPSDPLTAINDYGSCSTEL